MIYRMSSSITALCRGCEGGWRAALADIAMMSWMFVNHQDSILEQVAKPKYKCYGKQLMCQRSQVNPSNMGSTIELLERFSQFCTQQAYLLPLDLQSQ